MKNSNDTIWNRTRDLPACSAVPQATASGGKSEEKRKKKQQCNKTANGAVCDVRHALGVLPNVTRYHGSRVSLT